MFRDLIPTRDAQVDFALSDESGDVGRGQEDQGDWEVFNEGNVEARVSVELNVGAGEEVEDWLLEAALCEELDSPCGNETL